jgi:biopolymer transport protein ExbB/TolQ
MQFSLAELWLAMGPLAKGVVFLLAAMSLLSLTVAAEKWLTLQRAANQSRRFLQTWREAVAGQGYATAAASAPQYPQSPVAYVIATGTQVLTTTADASVRLTAYDRVVRQTILASSATAKKGLGLIATVGSTAPFVGLFGTIVGIINAFRTMAMSGQGGLSSVSAGIAEALVTTALGIGVAIPAVWLFNALTQRISHVLTEMESVAEELAVAALRQAPQMNAQKSSDTDSPEAAHGNAAWEQ